MGNPNSEFDNNGFGDGQSHNLYIGRVNSLTFRYNYSHHAKVGHNLKSRANENYILYNRIMDEETGYSSRLIDLPNGGLSIIMGNLLMQEPNAENNNLIGYGLEGLSNPITHDLLVINNTMINKRIASGLFISVQSGINSTLIHNNILAGSGTLLSGTSTAMSNNLAEPTINNVLFIDEPNYDYRIGADSPAVNQGLALNPFLGKSLIPDQQYVHPTNEATRTNIGVIDIGAYELGATLSLRDNSIENLSVYPNPTSKLLSIKTDAVIKKIVIMNTLGQSVLSNYNMKLIDVSNLKMGVYFLKVIDNNGANLVITFIKE